MKEPQMKIGQIAITVRDLDQAVAFYRDTVGLPFMFQAPNVAFFDCGVRFMLGLGESQDRKPYGTVVYFQVSDIQKTFTQIRDRNVAVVGEPHLVARLADFDLWMAFFRDPDENIFALMEERRDGRRPESAT